MTTEAANRVRSLLHDAMAEVGGRNRLAGELDLTPQALHKFLRVGEVSLKSSMKLQKLTGVSWREYAPQAAKNIDGIGHGPEGGCDHE